MKILSFHPFSLFANGGGNRILRRLYQGREAQVTSLVVEGVTPGLPKGNITEVAVYAFPITRWWMKWRLRNLAIWLRQRLFRGFTIRKIQRAAKTIQYDVLHVVNHGVFSAALCHSQFLNGKQLWVSFHDHFSTSHSAVDDTRQLWRRADRRLVISAEMGNEYARLFGNMNFEIITDGVMPEEVSQAAKDVATPCKIYFAGLLHLHYMPLFEVLANTLDSLSRGGHSFKLILRGTQQLRFLNGRLFETEYRPVTLNDAELKAELDAADLLYLPIKFTTPDFYRYSLSTKMVGYLGAPGSILYHGPKDSAACHLLDKSNAAVCCTTLNADELAECIKLVLSRQVQVSQNAKQLARLQFDLPAIQKRFWQQQ